MKISRRSLMKSTAAITATLTSTLTVATHADAEQTRYTVVDLKSALTPLGGLRAGNAEGTIPAWTGDLIPLPAGYVSGNPRPDPFAEEAPLLKITAANMAQYQDRLTAGDQHLLQTYPDYTLVVYPTHRTAIAPQYVYDYTAKNASTAQLSADGNNLSGAYGGAPFPIPTNGKQILWNHLLRWQGVTIFNPAGNWQVTSNGEVILRSFASLTEQNPYYIPGGDVKNPGIIQASEIVDTAPPYVEGEAVLFIQTVNPLQTPARGWEYELGERRVRLAPQLQYDTPVDIAGGSINWDEGEIFNGAVDQYDCKIIGKKEVYVPYNCNRAWTSRIADIAKPQHIDTSLFRWELHRVWVMEMTVAAGKRNVDARRVCYVDEDSWTILAMDVYDAGGSLWKYFQAVPALCSDVPGHMFGGYAISYEFHAKKYVVFAGYDGGTQWKVIPELPASYFTPGQLAASAGGS
jgi:hypothetical protein